jgi:HAD superfamily hydrolase (TIGR01458 family)
MAGALTNIRGFLFDLDGTVYEGSQAIPGAKETLDELRRRKVPYCFVTNTTSKPRSNIVERLHVAGISASPEQIFTAPAVARDWLLGKELKRCYFLLRAPLLADLDEVEAVDESPDAVVVGDMGDDFTYNKLNRAFRFLLDPKCAFVTLAKNRYFKGPEGLHMDVGAFVSALEYATGRQAELIGKPAPAFYQIACQGLELEAGEVAMVGDDLESDVIGAQAAGLKGILVRTGKFRQDHLDQSSEKPDLILDSIADLIGAI